MKKITKEAEAILIERFGKDSIIALATMADGTPYVRNVNAFYFDGAFYVLTYGLSNKMKQIAENPKVEISAFKDGVWLRLAGELVEDDRIEAKKSMLDDYANLRAMYDENDGNTQVLYFKNAVATFSSFTAPEEVIEW